MSLSDADVAHVALLARLGLDESERVALRAQLARILDHISLIDSVDTSAVPETAHVGGLVNVWRDDEPRPAPGADSVLDQAPSAEGRFFRVGAIQD